MAVSPDGQNVYVAGRKSSGLAVLRRGGDGSLTYGGCVGNPDAGTGIGPQGCTPALGLGEAYAVAVSPDGNHVYVAGGTSNGLAVLSRVPAPVGGGSGGGSGSGGSGSSGGSQGSGGSSGGGSSSPTTATASVGNQKIVVSLPASSGCLAPSAKLRTTFNVSAIAGSTASRLRFVAARYYIDRGVRHVHHHRVHRHGKPITVTTVSYTPNRTISSRHANLSFPLAGLKPGTHTLKIKVAFHRSEHGHSQSVIKTVTQKFSVCAK